MKWKRSKKAQQEAKLAKDENSSEKRQSSLNSTPSSVTKPSSSNQDLINNHVQQSSVSQDGVRRLQEGETLYRPYVV